MKMFNAFVLVLVLASTLWAEPTIHVNPPEGMHDGIWPVRTGVPMAKGAWPIDRSAVVLAPDGKLVPSQSKVLTTWQGGAFAKFLLLTFEADLAQREGYTVTEGTNPAPPLAQVDAAGNIHIDTGADQLTIPATGGGIVESSKWLGAPIRLRFVDENNTTYLSGDHERSVTLEENGPYAAVARISGWYESDASERLNRYVVRIYAHRGSNAVRILHTFINTGHCDQHRYREIAMDVPTHGATEPKVFVQTKTTDDTLPASIRSGDVTVAVRDFRLQHPCGYEQFADGKLAVQFWSPHQPRLFDLRPMQFIENHAPRAGEMYRTQAKGFSRPFEVIPELGGTLTLTGIGLGKSHEVMLRFGEGDVAVDHVPFAYVDPTYACATGALQPMHPRASGQFPEVEKLLDDYIEGFYAKRLQKTLYYDDSFGYFNFGDIKRQAGTSFHRYWMHAFYSMPRALWYLYYRSGDRRVRELAEQNSRHIMDLDTGHHTDPNNEYSRVGGGTHDDSSLFHHDGYRPQNDRTENYADYMVYMHQMTGDERAKEVALEVADAAKWLFARRKPGWAHRATGQGLKQTISLYELTWDEQLRPIIDHFAKQVLDHVRDGASTGYSGNDPTDFTLAYIFPAAIAYHRLTGDQAMRDWILSNADYLVRNGQCGNAGHFPKWDGMAYATLLTGDRRYLDPAWRAMNQWLTENDPVNDWGGFCFALSKTPMVLAAASQFDSPPAPVGQPLISTTEVAMRHAPDQPRIVSAVVFGPWRAKDFEATKSFTKMPTVLLRNPEGKVIATRHYPADGYDKWYASGGWVETFALNANQPAGVYRVQLINMPKPVGADEPFIHDTTILPAWLAVSADGPMPMTARITPEGLPPGGRYGHGVQYFHVPTDVEQFTISIQQVGSFRRKGVVNLIDPDGHVVATTTFEPYESLRWFTLEAKPTPQQRGRTWSLDIPAIDEVYRLKFDGIEPYLTDDPSRVIAMP